LASTSSSICQGADYAIREDVLLWKGAPSRDDFAKASGDNNNPWWKEMSAITNSIFQLKKQANGATTQSHWK
jgi:hypothetical protein